MWAEHAKKDLPLVIREIEIKIQANAPTHPPEWVNLKTAHESASEDEQQPDTSNTVGEIRKWCTMLEDSLAFYKVKHTLTASPGNSTGI